MVTTIDKNMPPVAAINDQPLSANQWSLVNSGYMRDLWRRRAAADEWVEALNRDNVA